MIYRGCDSLQASRLPDRHTPFHSRGNSGNRCFSRAQLVPAPASQSPAPGSQQLLRNHHAYGEVRTVYLGMVAGDAGGGGTRYIPLRMSCAFYTHSMPEAPRINHRRLPPSRFSRHPPALSWHPRSRAQRFRSTLSNISNMMTFNLRRLIVILPAYYGHILTAGLLITSLYHFLKSSQPPPSHIIARLFPIARLAISMSSHWRPRRHPRWDRVQWRRSPSDRGFSSRGEQK
jgi:hypothetical protein